MADWRQERIAKNEVSFRAINERLERGLRRLPDDRDRYEFVCECGNRECTQMVSLSLPEYEEVRSNAKHFAVLPGHMFADVERLIREGEGYVVVEKIGETTEIAEDNDPRS